MNTEHSGLSGPAQVLLQHLCAFAHRPENAVKDETIAKIHGIPARTVIDLADELLQAGHLVIARCIAPFGRWILLPHETEPALWAEARAYCQSLRDRGVSVLSRAKHAESALRRTEAARPATRPASPPGPPVRFESTGQGRLFG